ncbi:MAG: ParB/RepB/Spo0J family partition protein [Oscillospiraceae bacterium]
MRTKVEKSGEVILVNILEVSPSPYQARTVFREEDIKKLAVSIIQNGLLQPISVRRTADKKFQLIAGERRLRACKMAGMAKIPAIVWDIEDNRTAALSLLENIQREQLGPFEQAFALKEIIKLWDCTQEAAAHRLGISQSALANKLRILSLTKEQQDICTNGNLTERHARAVLPLDADKRTQVLNAAVKYDYNVAKTEELVRKLITAGNKPMRKLMIRDVRIFVNTINRAIDTMIKGGIAATAVKNEQEDYIEYVVHIPRQSTNLKIG